MLMCDHSSTCGIILLTIQNMHTLTKVSTVKDLCLLISAKHSHTFTVSFSFNLSSIQSKMMKTPDLPTPELQCTTRGEPSCLCSLRTRLMNPMKEVADEGTPVSGQPSYWKWETIKGVEPVWKGLNVFSLCE